MSAVHPRDATVSTLRAAHETVHRDWPGRHASAQAWLAYHQRAAALYRAVADVDQAHHHEALYMAQFATEAAQSFARESVSGRVQESRGPPAPLPSPDAPGRRPATRSTRRRQDAPNLPRRAVAKTMVGREFAGRYRPSMFVTLTCDSYGRVRDAG